MLLMKLKTLFKFHQFFSTNASFLGSHIAFSYSSLVSLTVFNTSSVVACLSWPWYFLNVLVTLSNICLFLMIRRRLYIVWKNTTEMSPYCIISWSSRCGCVLLVILTIILWLRWFLLAFSTVFPFIVKKYLGERYFEAMQITRFFVKFCNAF